MTHLELETHLWADLEALPYFERQNRLVEAARRGDLQLVDALEIARVAINDPDESGTLALHAACATGNV